MLVTPVLGRLKRKSMSSRPACATTCKAVMRGEEGDTDVTQFVELLPNMYESPMFAPQQHIHRAWWFMPVIPTVPGEGRIPEVQGHPWQHTEFESSLGYLTH